MLADAFAGPQISLRVMAHPLITLGDMEFPSLGMKYHLELVSSICLSAEPLRNKTVLPLELALVYFLGIIFNQEKNG